MHISVHTRIHIYKHKDVDIGIDVDMDMDIPCGSFLSLNQNYLKTLSQHLSPPILIRTLRGFPPFRAYPVPNSHMGSSLN